MSLPLKEQIAPIRTVLFSRRTGPFLWSVAIGAASYVILAAQHAANYFWSIPIQGGVSRVAQALTVIGAIAFATQILTMLSYIKLNDEFMRSVVFKRLAFAAMSTILIATIWSLLADMNWAPAFDASYLYLLFLGVCAVLLPFMNADRP